MQHLIELRFARVSEFRLRAPFASVANQASAAVRATPTAGHTEAQRERTAMGENLTRGPEQHSGMASVVERNIRALIDHREEQNRTKGLQDRLADAITTFTGSMKFVYLHVAIFGLWIVVNVGWLPPVPRFDETFVVLAMAASVEAIFLSTFVLISQNRMAALADKRAELDLQISLLAEHEVTRLVTLVREIAKQMQIEQSHDPELAELERDVRPEKVLHQMDQAERNLARTPPHER
jgi:uncharacterized membrane protein